MLHLSKTNFLLGFNFIQFMSVFIEVVKVLYEETFSSFVKLYFTGIQID